MSAIAPIKHEMKLRFGNCVVACAPGEIILIDMDSARGGCSYDISCFRLFVHCWLCENNRIAFSIAHHDRNWMMNLNLIHVNYFHHYDLT